MRHSELLKNAEKALVDPFTIVEVNRIGTITHDNSAEKFAGEQRPCGEYGIIDLRIIVPLDALD